MTTLLVNLESDSSRVLIEDGVDATHIETGHLLYTDPSGGLWAVPFDPEHEDVVGEPTQLFSELTVYANRARYSVSKNGTLVYGAGAGGGNSARANLVVADNAGNLDVSPLSPRRFISVRWSPDGRTIAYASTSEGKRLIYTHDIELGTTPHQRTIDGDGGAPVWSPDGTRIAFSWVAPGTLTVDVFVKNLTYDSPPELVLPRPGFQAPTDWPSEDALVVGSDGDLWILDPADSTSVTPYLESEAVLGAAQISPDGTLAAYTSNETGPHRVYVSSFPDPRQPTPVSLGEARFPRWAPDGNTLFYWKPGTVDTLYAARVATDPTFEVISREVVFGISFLQSGNADLHPDGDRWAAARSEGARAVSSGEPERFLVVTNWFTELRAALGGDRP